MYRHHPQFHVLLEGMDTSDNTAADNMLAGGGGGDGTADGGTGGLLRAGSSNNPGGEMGRASSLLAGTSHSARHTVCCSGCGCLDHHLFVHRPPLADAHTQYAQHSINSVRSQLHTNNSIVVSNQLSALHTPTHT